MTVSAGSVEAGACWVCEEGNGYVDLDMQFSAEMDAFYHPECLPDGCETLLEYETQTGDR